MPRPLSWRSRWGWPISASTLPMALVRPSPDDYNVYDVDDGDDDDANDGMGAGVYGIHTYIITSFQPPRADEMILPNDGSA